MGNPSTTIHSSNDLMELEDQLHGQITRLAGYYRRRGGSQSAGLHSEAQFMRRLREYCNKEIADIEGVIAEPELYSR